MTSKHKTDGILRRKIANYFKICDACNAESKDVKKPYTLSGMLSFLGITRKEFEVLAVQECHARVLSDALAKIEAFIEENALIGALSSNAAANSLKYNFGWGSTKTTEKGDDTIKIILDGELEHLAE